jgi:hypothetical protein
MNCAARLWLEREWTTAEMVSTDTIHELNLAEDMEIRQGGGRLDNNWYKP